MADNGTLSCKKHRFLQALLQAKSIREAARQGLGALVEAKRDKRGGGHVT